MSLSPFNAWVVLKGLETLAIRMRAQSASALALAQWLETVPGIERVYHPAWLRTPARAGDGAAIGQGGAVVSFIVAGGRDGAWSLIDGTRHLLHHRQPGRHQDHHHPPIEHLARASERKHSGCPPAIVQGLVRVAVGLEDLEDLKARPRARPACPMSAHDDQDPHPHRPVADGFPAPGHGAHGAVFLAYARHHGGEFVLRIEDTDVVRSTQDSVDQILAAMAWLGLDYDEGPIYQMQRLERYARRWPPNSSSPPARPTAATARPRSSTRCARHSARAARRRCTTAAGGRARQDAAGGARRRETRGALCQPARRRRDLGRSGQGPDQASPTARSTT